MYHSLAIPEKCNDLWRECQSLVPVLLQDCPVKEKGKIIEANSTFTPNQQSVYLITEGEISESLDKQLIVIHEKQDLINLDALAHPKSTIYETDFSATVDEYDGAALMASLADKPAQLSAWNRYLSCLSQSYQILMSHFSRQDTSYLPEFRQFNNGDIIIEEGTEGDEVFTLLTGTAKVMCKGEEVGIIKSDEIFGAIAALTNTKRNATIIATSDCDILVAKSENFESLLATRPDVVHKLVRDMARTIVTSNQKIIELSKEST